MFLALATLLSQLSIAFRSNADSIVMAGPSGSGKTMTIQLIAGILQPDCGHISIGDRVLFDSETKFSLKAKDRKIGYVFQNAEEQLRELANDYLEIIAKKVRNEGIHVKIFSLIGVPYKEIIGFSEQERIDLLIMCSRGESGISRWLLGSITDRVIRGSRIPVLVVPAIE